MARYIEMLMEPYRSSVEGALPDTPAVHTHSHWVKRPWWKWRPWWDRESHKLEWVRQDRVEVPCEGQITDRSQIKYEMERYLLGGDMGLRVVASRQYICETPIVGVSDRVILYCAFLVPEPNHG